MSRGREAGDWEIGELLDEGPGWQDFEGTPTEPGARRRIRVYLAGAAATGDEEKRLRREAEARCVGSRGARAGAGTT